MAESSFDLIVVGGGPGGYTAAIRAAQLGMRVALVERERLGGICLNWGCIPTKALLKNAELVAALKAGKEWGIEIEGMKIDFARVIQRSRSVADRLSKGVEFLMKKNKIEVRSGYGRLLGDGRVEVKAKDLPDEILRAKHVILATGARPRSLPGVALDRQRIITSTEAMTLRAIPQSMIVIGAGAIGIEFAYFYQTLGTKVTVVEMLPGILPVEDREITKELERIFRKRGMEILTGTSVQKVKAGKDGVTVNVQSEDGAKELLAEIALVAIGVQGNVENLGLEELGVAVEKDRIKVDTDYRTNIQGLYAIGDVIGPPWLAHVASAEGIHCVEAIAGKSPDPLDYSSIPGCTYCQPQVASIGLTEQKALELGKEIKVGKFPFRALGKAIAIGETDGMVKLIFDRQYGELLGAHILGPEATETIMELLIAKRHEATASSILHSVHAHPTLSEAVMEAAAAAEGEAINI
ncbi:MAG: dihydrolipoyl dehydrogenase [Bacteroidota bacterium]